MASPPGPSSGFRARTGTRHRRGLPCRASVRRGPWRARARRDRPRRRTGSAAAAARPGCTAPPCARRCLTRRGPVTRPGISKASPSPLARRRTPLPWSKRCASRTPRSIGRSTNGWRWTRRASRRRSRPRPSSTGRNSPACREPWRPGRRQLRRRARPAMGRRALGAPAGAGALRGRRNIHLECRRSLRVLIDVRLMTRISFSRGMRVLVCALPGSIEIKRMCERSYLATRQSNNPPLQRKQE